MCGHLASAWLIEIGTDVKNTRKTILRTSQQGELIGAQAPQVCIQLSLYSAMEQATAYSTPPECSHIKALGTFIRQECAMDSQGREVNQVLSGKTSR